MAHAYDLSSPEVVVIDTSGGDMTFESNRTLRGIDIFTNGDLSITDVAGETVTVTFPTPEDGGTYPYRWIVQIKTIHDTATTIADADLVGLR